MNEMQWETPPRPTRKTGTPGEQMLFVEQLKARPGEWARWPNPVPNGRSARNKMAFPGTEWAQRKQPDGTLAMWARWVGES